MRYQEFVNQIVEHVRSEVDDRASVTVRPIRRNNDFSSDGLNIVRDANLFSPTVFLDECYDDYLKGRDIDHIVSDITGFYHSHEKVHSLDISYFYDFHEVSPHLAVKLINYERNAELLREVPYERFLDLAVVCYCLVEHTVFGAGSILVKKVHLDYWGVTKAALFQTAMENTLHMQHLLHPIHAGGAAFYYRYRRLPAAVYFKQPAGILRRFGDAVSENHGRTERRTGQGSVYSAQQRG